ncbi:MAG: ABC transporter ATP-binding protein [Proteobacteria bacterium]|nr:ABC transporter ATP-binding protein [Pseudomonadota bacterium]
MHGKELIIDMEGVTYSYPGGASVLDELDFKLHRGDRIGLIAPNGSGKTTLFHIIMGLIKPSAGTIKIFGRPAVEEKDFIKVRQKIGLLFQDADDQLFSPTVLEDVAFGPLNLGKSREEAIAISRKTLAYLGLEGFEDRVAFKLSGGEKRLVSLATVLAMEPKALLLDEPTTGLDNETKNRLMEVLMDLDLSCIMISHEIDFISRFSDALYTMENGKILMDEKLHVHRHEHAHKLGKTPHRHV